jgi:PAS domain-containing protein
MPTLFLDGIGDVADRIREVDWSRTALGLRERWPPLLTTVLNIVLGARQPMFIAWGPLRTFLYNDGYRSLLGERHPGAFGQPFFEVWPDCQAEFAPVFEKVFAGQSVMIDDMALHLERRGQPEEAHFSFSYTPVREHSGAVIGLLCACTETTAQIQMERRWHAERRELRRLLQKMPGFAAVLSGPTHVVQYVNDAFVALTGARPFVGNPLRDSLPELAGQGMIGLLDQVFVTGKSFAARALPLQLSGAPDTRFVDLVTEPLSDERGCITGVFAGRINALPMSCGPASRVCGS